MATARDLRERPLSSSEEIAVWRGWVRAYPRTHPLHTLGLRLLCRPNAREPPAARPALPEARRRGPAFDVDPNKLRAIEEELEARRLLKRARPDEQPGEGEPP